MNSSKRGSADDVFIAMFFAAICFVAGIVFGGCHCEKAMRRDAVKHGVAEFVIVDAEKGTTEFRWKGSVEAP